MAELKFKEGEEYSFEELPDSDMNKNGKLEALGDGRLAARYGEKCVEFEWSKVRCIDVTHVSEL